MYIRRSAKITVAFRPYQVVVGQCTAVVVARPKELAERIGVKTLPDDSGRLQCLLVVGVESVHPGQHQTLD